MDIEEKLNLAKLLKSSEPPILSIDIHLSTPTIGIHQQSFKQIAGISRGGILVNIGSKAEVCCGEAY